MHSGRGFDWEIKSTCSVAGPPVSCSGHGAFKDLHWHLLAFHREGLHHQGRESLTGSDMKVRQHHNSLGQSGLKKTTENYNWLVPIFEYSLNKFKNGSFTSLHLMFMVKQRLKESLWSDVQVPSETSKCGQESPVSPASTITCSTLGPWESP